MLTQERKKPSFLGSNKNKTKLKIHTANIPSDDDDDDDDDEWQEALKAEDYNSLYQKFYIKNFISKSLCQNVYVKNFILKFIKVYLVNFHDLKEHDAFSFYI